MWVCFSVDQNVYVWTWVLEARRHWSPTSGADGPERHAQMAEGYQVNVRTFPPSIRKDMWKCLMRNLGKDSIQMYSLGDKIFWDIGHRFRFPRVFNKHWGWFWLSNRFFSKNLQEYWDKKFAPSSYLECTWKMIHLSGNLCSLCAISIEWLICSLVLMKFSLVLIFFDLTVLQWTLYWK